MNEICEDYMSKIWDQQNWGWGSGCDSHADWSFLTKNLHFYHPFAFFLHTIYCSISAFFPSEDINWLVFASFKRRHLVFSGRRDLEGRSRCRWAAGCFYKPLPLQGNWYGMELHAAASQEEMRTEKSLTCSIKTKSLYFRTEQRQISF